MRTACRLGAVAINYMRTEAIHVDAGRVASVTAVDAETDERFELRAKAIFNATGVWVDKIRTMAAPTARPLVTLSRGSHLVVDARFLPGNRALMIPKTADGRVLFAIPWLDHLVVGTTDVPTDEVRWDPQPTREEVAFIVETARGYLRDLITESDIRNTFAGLRPLVARGAPGATKTLSREHSIVIEHGNLITVTGGKWTTYRRMAVDALQQAARCGLLPAGRSSTETLRLDVDPVIEATSHAAGAEPQDTAALLRYRDIARACEQARTDSDFLERRLRIGLVDPVRAEHLARVLT
jgi:glycerol-3-phosphate dehydrogenase